MMSGTKPSLPNWVIAFEANREAYLAHHPEPQTIDFTCPRCGAIKDEPCSWPGRRVPPGSGFHAPRMDKVIKAWNLRQWDASNHAYNLENERAGDTHRDPTDQHLRYLRRVS